MMEDLSDDNEGQRKKAIDCQLLHCLGQKWFLHFQLYSDHNWIWKANTTAPFAICLDLDRPSVGSQILQARGAHHHLDHSLLCGLQDERLPADILNHKQEFLAHFIRDESCQGDFDVASILDRQPHGLVRELPQVPLTGESQLCSQQDLVRIVTDIHNVLWAHLLAVLCNLLVRDTDACRLRDVHVRCAHEDSPTRHSPEGAASHQVERSVGRKKGLGLGHSRRKVDVRVVHPHMAL
mmetsp:Transcript_50133/g.145379  ORF Transcript_50133/g.145379 Transcript_50133/m.145379 type:complete len:237 (-) Transcript_50133:1532-2242(-)